MGSEGGRKRGRWSWPVALSVLVTACAGDEPQLPLETIRQALEVCQSDSDCPVAPPCATARCAGGECRFVLEDPDCCVDDGDCVAYDDCLLGWCVTGGGESGQCATMADPSRPGCCNYPFECDLAPPGYVAQCLFSQAAGYSKCSYGVDPEYCQSPFNSLVINEFLANPGATEDATGEYIELFNPSLEPVLLNGWALRDEDTDEFVFDSLQPIAVPPGGHFLLARSDNPLFNGQLKPDWVYYNFVLSNGDDEIILVDLQGNEVDRVEYGPPSFAVVEGFAFHLVSPYLDNGKHFNWKPATTGKTPSLDKGTPGAPNTDTFHFFYVPLVCNDGDPCTLDTCGQGDQGLCTHSSIAGCCNTDGHCEDNNPCTQDSCLPVSLTCSHSITAGCCSDDSDCPFYSTCTFAQCFNHKCRYLVKPELPGCCVVDSDCKDSNSCTIDFCSLAPGASYKSCHHNHPVGTVCCKVDLDCNDGKVETLESCLSGKCVYKANPDYCNGLPATGCDDGNPCTTDSCNLVTKLCQHQPLPGCCLADGQCDDSDPCTQDYCQLALHTCGHAPVVGCCHADQDCAGFMADQGLCKEPICVGGQCRLKRLPGSQCCLTAADCNDGDGCTDDLCDPGTHLCSHLPKGKGCCNSALDCPADNDPCTVELCLSSKCTSQLDSTCCKGDWQCDDDNPCTVDLCVAYRCRFLPDPGGHCCSNAGDCAPPCSPCTSLTCAAGGYCLYTALSNCKVLVDYQEDFGCSGSLSDSGWRTQPAGLGDFTRTAGGALGEDLAATLPFETPLTGGQSCLVSPAIQTLHPLEPLALAFHQSLEALELAGPAGAVKLTVGARPQGLPTIVPLATLDPSANLPGTTLQLPIPDKLKSSPFELLFCLEALQGLAPHRWVVDSVQVGRGHPPRVLVIPSAVAMLPGEFVALTLPVEDQDGDPLSFHLSAPSHTTLSQVAKVGPGQWQATVQMAPQTVKDLGTQVVALELSDGFFVTAFLFEQTVYLPLCTDASDCDDGDECTVDSCNPIKGCLHATVAGCCSELTPCQDGDPCTVDLCVDGGCQFPALVCDDGNPCTGDFCEPDKGCQHPFLNGIECEDNNLCTSSDFCFKGSCTGLPVDCSDGLKCTLDTCSPQLGCNNKSLCADSLLCTTDVCTKKGCKSGKVPVGTPYLDGQLAAEEWPPSTVAGSSPDGLTALSLMVDSGYLFVAIQAPPLATGGTVLLLDSDFPAATGLAKPVLAQTDEGELAALLAIPVAVDFQGFGTDLSVSVVFGADPGAGPIAAGCHAWSSEGQLTPLFCPMALGAAGAVEVALPWLLLFPDGGSLNHRVGAAALFSGTAGELTTALPAAAFGTISDVMVWGIPDPQCLISFCGDGVVDGGEECDLGEQNSDQLPDGCRTNCKNAWCGDGVVDSGEGCDDGPLNSDLVADGCRTNCKLPWCGDGVVDSGEECDDGIYNDDSAPGGCRTNCKEAWCGDGTFDPGEECDDGNQLDWDGCQGNCTLYFTVCGDGIQTPDEECDWGENNSDSTPDSCRIDCKLPWCGDGVVDSGESCDDGNQQGGDECGNDCKPYKPWCGNGWLDPGEECDLGPGNSNFQPDGCRTNCKQAWCGDGVVDSGEECDDGNQSSLDGCAPDCTVEPYIPEAGDIIFTEIMQNPAKVYDTLGEYLELYNTRNYPIDISGWELTSDPGESHLISVSEPLIVAPGGYLVLGLQKSKELNGGLTVDYQYSAVILGNDADFIALFYKGFQVDKVLYDGGPAFPDPKGAAMSLRSKFSNHLANDLGTAWCEAITPLPSGDLGTPGSATDCQ